MGSRVWGVIFACLALTLPLVNYLINYAVALPTCQLGTDPDDVSEDHLDIRESYYNINSTHVSFIITCQSDIITQKEKPTQPKNDFQVCLDLKAGTGDNRRGVLFEGADVIVTAHDRKVYYWIERMRRGRWVEYRFVTVYVKVSGRNITITCKLEDVDYKRVLGDVKVGFISNTKKVGIAKLNKGLDRAPDEGWYTIEGGIPDMGLTECVFTCLLGFTAAYKLGRLRGMRWVRSLLEAFRRVLKSGVVKYLMVMVISMILTYIVFIRFMGEIYYNMVAEVSVYILKALGVPCEVEGNLIALKLGSGWSVIRVSWECSGVVSLTVFIGLVSGFPRARLWEKALGLTLGCLGVIFGNILRVVSILYLSSSFPWTSYILFHDLFGRPLSFLWMVTIWFFWFYYIFVKSPRNP